MRKIALCIALAGVTLAASAQPAGRAPFNEGWTFEKDGVSRDLDLPHDWGVEGSFRQEYPGESGKLPWWGRASYRKSLEITEEELATKDIDLEIDGAMSYATVEVNGVDLGGWPYGYASFAVRLNPALKAGQNEIAVHIDNPEESSRWYPGGGLYRNVWITKTNKTSVARWGTYITTDIRNITVSEQPRKFDFDSVEKLRRFSPSRKTWTDADADITLRVTLKHAGEKTVGMIRTQIIYQESVFQDGQRVTVDRVLAETRSIEYIEDGKTIIQTFELPHAALWTLDSPVMYLARTTVETPD
jgi:Beta-galactosidase/beta-glucuronidase